MGKALVAIESSRGKRTPTFRLFDLLVEKGRDMMSM
jgi:hypothetical protein